MLTHVSAQDTGEPELSSSWFGTSIVYDLVYYVYPLYIFWLLWSTLSIVSILSIWFAPALLMNNKKRP